MSDKIGVALIGSGIFVKEQHLPAVQKCQDLQLKAIYSRSLKSARGVSEGLTDVALYSDDSDQTYADLLKRDDVQAVIIALPIPVQPEIIKQALNAGKHVLAEKPLAKDIETGRDLVAYYREKKSSSTFAVAEQFRYLNSYLHAASEIAKLGRVIGVQHRLHFCVQPGSKYIETAWRKVPEYQGGFLLDGGVHQIAALRLMLGSVKVQSVAAHTAQLRDWLPPVDSVDAALKLDNGATGFLSMSFGSSFDDAEIAVACEEGTVSVDRQGAVTVRKAQGGGEEPVTEVKKNEEGGVATEVWAWARSIKAGRPDERQSPEEALADLEMLEALLKSGEKGGAPVELRLQV